MFSRIFFAVLLAAAALDAQTSTATLQGTVHDPSGAILAGAAVRVTNEATGTVTDSATNSSGHYLVPYLLPGTYAVNVEQKGFQRHRQSGIKLDVGQSRAVDVTLTVGDVTTTVEVQGTPPPLATTQSVVGATTEMRAINDLPLNGRVALELVLLVPGVVPSEGTAGSSIGVANASPYPHSFTPWISGSRNATSEVLMDGVPLGLPNTNLGTMAMGVSGPTVDAVQEFTVLINALPAEYGRTGGGVINTASKQGTNVWHGSLFEFVRNSAMDANYFFANRAGTQRASFKRNHLGGSIGGPILIPKVYNGRNRTFFFFDLERALARSPNINTMTVPLAAWKQGNYAGLRSAGGTPISIYDPLTVQVQPNGTYLRDPFPGNVIPQARMDRVGRNLMQYYPEPNTPPTNVNTQTNNWTRTGADKANSLDFGTRVDHNISDKWRTFARVTHGYNNTNPLNVFGNPGTPLGRGNQKFHRNAIGWDHTYLFNASTVLNVRYGMSRMNLHIDALSFGFKPSELGLPAYLDAEAAKNELRFPRFDITGLTSLGQANSAGIAFVPTTHNVLGSVTKILSRHTIKTGAEYRKLLLNFWQENVPAGTFTINTTWSQQGPSTATGGHSLASLLLGLPSSGSQANNIFVSTASSYYAFFIQDEFRVSRRLTLNLGLRYDFDIPRTERFDQLSWWDSTAPSPLAGKVPGYPDLRGAMMFAQPGSRQQGQADRNNIGPRFGFAYRINDKTSFRGAYTIQYGPSQLQAGYKGNEGFATTTAMTVSLDGRNPLNYISNPFPYGFNKALGATPGQDSGPSTNIGLAVGNSWFPANDSPMIQQWNATLQRELPAGFLVELGYLANKGNHVADGETLNYNQLPATYLSWRERLNNLVANPFAAAITNPNSTLSRTTVTNRQLLAAYPQYSAVNLGGSTYGNSLYHAFTMRAERRFSKAIGVRTAYTFGKLIDDSGFASTLSAGGATTRQDIYNRGLDRAVSSQDISSRMVISSNAELPFGRGRKVLGHASRLVNGIVGGWQANGIITLQTGLPIPISQSLNQTGLGNPSQRPDNNGKSAKLSGDRSKDEQMGQWFNVTNFTIAQAFTFGATGRTLPDVRQPGKRTFNLSLFKSFPIKERLRATFRAEAFNIFNTTQFGYANAQIGNTQVGTISSTSVDPRQIQLALKLQW
jgi:hypothetical protein